MLVCHILCFQIHISSKFRLLVISQTSEAEFRPVLKKQMSGGLD